MTDLSNRSDNSQLIQRFQSEYQGITLNNDDQVTASEIENTNPDHNEIKQESVEHAQLIATEEFEDHFEFTDKEESEDKKICEIDTKIEIFTEDIQKNTPVKKDLKLFTGIQCGKCKQYFPNQIKLNQHLNRKYKCHKKEKLVCRSCNQKFKFARHFQDHLEIRNDCRKNVLKCKNCEKTFKSKGGLEYHIEKKACRGEVIKKYNFTCEKCEKKFQWSRHFNDHMAKKYDCRKVVPKCEKCDKVFKIKKGLEYHINNKVCKAPHKQEV